MSAKVPKKIYLEESEIPRQWYNMRADMKEQHAPYLHPGTHQPIKTEELYPIFCEELAKQEMNETDRFIDIPEGIQDFYRIFRPSPVIRAYELEKALGTPARIYYKFEGNNTSGPAINSILRGCEGVLCQATGIEGTDHGNRSRPVGNCAFHGVCLFRFGSDRIHGQSLLQQKPYRKAVHGDIWIQT